MGVGRTVGSVDLPVARDGFGYPYIPGSSIKGVVKSRCYATYPDNAEKCTRYYGVDQRYGEALSEEALWISPVALTDAQLLLYPARIERMSRDGGSGSNRLRLFMYASSPLLINRYNEFVESLGASACSGSNDPLINVDGGDKPRTGDIMVNNTRVGEDEYFTLKINPELSEPIKRLGKLHQYLLSGMGGDVNAEEILVVKNEDSFLDIVEAGIIRQTRVRLDPKRKAVISGGLWSEEYVSQATVFYFAGIYRSSMTNTGRVLPDEACTFNENVMLGGSDTGYLVIGGKETVGKGLVGITRLG